MQTKTFKIIVISFALFFFLLLLFTKSPSEEKSDLSEASNKAARIKIIQIQPKEAISELDAPKGWTFLVIDTQWENIHPKEKVEKSKLEGKTDRTMGVKTFTRGKKKKKEEYVEVDVVYKVEKLYDHAYLAADGLAFSLHESTEDIPGGSSLQKSFTIAKQGEVKAANFLFLIPKDARNLCFQFFDYEYGHIVIPIQGDVKKALGVDGLPGPVLSLAKSEYAEVAVRSIEYKSQYAENPAPEGWRYGVVYLGGKSLLGQRIKDIVQIQPEEYTWVTTKGGYFYYCEEASTTDEGLIRFTPEIFQHQDLAFLIPGSAEIVQLGIRLQNQVLQLGLTEEEPDGLPDALTTHRDGDVMEVMLFGMKKERSGVILDLGIRSLVKSGIEIQMEPQFILLVGDEKIYVDEETTETLFHRPPEPFIVPPGTTLRFELAYETEGSPTSFYFRGYESENYFRLIKDD